MRMSKQVDLSTVILGKCQELGCEDCNDVAEMLGGATLIILKSISYMIGASLDEVRETYVKALEHAELEES